MTFQVSDFNDLIRLLQAHPEWQVQLRNVLLSDDFLALPNIVRQLGERMDQLTERVDRLGERMDQLTERVDRLGERIDQLTVSIDQRFAEIDRRFELIDHRFIQIEGRLLRLENGVADLQGWQLEDRYQKNGAVYFGKLLRKSRIVRKEVLADHLYDVLNESEFESALLIDVVVKGKLQVAEDSFREIYLALEVSRTIKPEDITRAVERARLISRVGIPTIPVVAGEFIHEDTFRLAREAKAVVYFSGSVNFWHEALMEYANFN